MNKNNETCKHGLKVCPCGKGHCSQYDGKCGHCRTRKQQAQYEKDHRDGKYNKEKEAVWMKN